MLVVPMVYAEQIAPVTIERKPGHEDGQAQMIEKGKVRKITPHAVAAWRARGGDAALVIVLRHTKGAKEYLLRYYDLDSGRSRSLGASPIASGHLVETKTTDEGWAFALSGTDSSGRAVVIVGDDQAIPGHIADAHDPDFRGDTLVFEQAGATKTAKLGVLLGTELHAIYAPPQSAQTAPKYLQVFPNGTAAVELNDATIRKGTWSTNGNALELHGKGVEYSVPVSGLAVVKGVPAGERFSVRLTQELSSVTTHEGDTVKGVSISPVVENGEILIPLGSVFEGTVVQADSVGWGFKHETASLTIEWKKATLSDGRVLEMDARVFSVENAQEKVDENGKIKGIRSTGTLGHSVENGVLSLGGVDPVAYIFASSSGSGMLGFAEPEILYPAGTELLLENRMPLVTSTVYPPSVYPLANDAAQKEKLQAFVKGLPFRTRTKGSNKVSDLTNLVFVGSPEALRRAFAAAGWLPTDDLNADSTFRTVKTITGNQTYTQAPMSVLLLDERPPLFALSKTTNTFASRHHLRIFPTEQAYSGQTVMTSSSTQDVGIAFSKKQKTFIHVIDQHIDNERSKVVNDLIFTGCVDSLDMVDRPWVPRDAYNSTGDRLLTDGAAAVLRINRCEDPHAVTPAKALPPQRFERITRDTSLTIRNDVYRGNLIYQGISGGLKAHSFLRSAGELPEDSGAWRKTDASGAEYTGFGENPGLHRRGGEPPETAPDAADLAEVKKAQESHKWDPPRYELALQGGYMHMRADYLSAVGILEISSDPAQDSHLAVLQDEVNDGWAAGGSVTINSWKHFSNEFSYFRQQVKYRLDSLDITLPSDRPIVDDDASLASIPIGLVTRQFEYNLLLHAKPPTSRWRPYAAVGPAFQLIALNGAPLKHPAGVYTLGLKNIGLFQAAYDFGNTPPLDGGGIFQFGLQYGAGIKYRVSPRMMLRADWRETWSKSPDIIADSYQDFDPPTLDETYSTEVVKVKPEQKFIQSRFTIGVAFTF